jgi:hypothetical protein
MERLKGPEAYIELFTSVKKGRITAKDALWIEKKETAHLPGTGWYEMHPFGFDLGAWNEKEDALKDVDIDAWNAKAHKLVSGVRAKSRKLVLFICCLLAPTLLIAGIPENDPSFIASGIFFLVAAAILSAQFFIACLKAR